MSQLERDPEWSLPRELEEYEILRPLGAGAMGRVYVARDRLLDRLVAIKVIARVRPDRATQERFAREARAIARLQHPNVVSVYRVGQVSGRPYMVSEYVAGRPLDRLAAPVAPEQVAELAIGLARGLAAAHRCGVLHRDIKPANALLRDTGEVVLVDFGLAKLVDEDAPEDSVADPRDDDGRRASLRHLLDTIDPAGAADDADDRHDGLTLTATASVDPAFAVTATGPVDPNPALTATDAPAYTGSVDAHPDPHDGLLTAAGQWVGTPLYMAPELWTHAPATRRSDIYSLGAVLYQLATGHPPHRADDIDALHERVLAADASPLTELAPDVPAPLAAIIHRCLARDPAARFASADALREALEATRGAHLDLDGAVDNPYRGLRAFTAAHKRWFFGRDAELRAVLDRLRAAPVVVLAGDSGTGKSSLCRAGVVPAVVEGALQDGATAYAAISLVPGRHPLDALAGALAHHMSLAADDVARVLRDEPLGLARNLRRRDQPLVVFVDQLEELITLAEPEQAADTARALAALTADSGAARLLATVRSDYLSRVAALPGLGAALADGLYLLRPMSAEAIREIITAPAARCGVEFENEPMIAELAAFVEESPGSLPLLQFTLAELWQHRDRMGARIPAAALTEIGGVQGALARHAESVFLPLADDQRAVAARLLTRLVSAEGTGLRRTRDELVDGAPGATQEVLETLVHGRLIIAGEAGEAGEAGGHGERGGGTYQLAHEVLVDGWPRMREWLRRDAAEHALRERLERAANEWHRLERPRDGLWTGRRLRELRESRTLDAPGRLGAREREFVRASVAARRRAVVVRWGAIAAAIAAIAIAWVGVRAQARAQRNAEIDRQHGAARIAIDEAAAHADLGREQRERAFARFDARDTTAGERLWAAALASERDAIRDYRRAERAIAAALRVEPGHERSHALIADVLEALARLADEGHRHDERDRLIEELGVHAPRRMEAWSAPVALVVDRQPAGARIDLFRYRPDDGGRLRPVPVAAAGRPPRVAPGSYLVEIAAPGFATARYPVVMTNGQDRRITVRLPPTAAVPAGFAYVPAGSSLIGSAAPEVMRDGFFAAPPLHPVFVPGYLIATTEVTMAQWLAFLDDLPPDERERRAPNAGHGAHAQKSLGVFVARDESGRWQIEIYRAGQTLRARAGEPLRYPGRDHRAAQDWLRMPVAGVSFDDARAYAAWLDRTGRVPRARLCTSLEWERAARGADGRRFPGGDRLHPDDANFDETYGRKPLAFGADEVGSHPLSRSPFGVDDMAGNVWEWMEREPGGTPMYRGGSWYQAALNADIANREPGEPAMRDALLGLRICAALPE